MNPHDPRTRPFAAEVTVMGVPLSTDELAMGALMALPAPQPESGGVLLPAEPYRPTERPPVALLTILDDGASEGETIRLRNPAIRIGRTTCDIQIPHDGRISSPHVMLGREKTEAGWRWTITDAGGTDGLFIRVSRLQLSNGTEFLVGRGRYRYTPAPAPTLVELVDGVPVASFVLEKLENWIGTAAECDIRRNDRFVEPWHARVFTSPGRGWTVQHDKTLNGVWLRVPQVTVAGVCFFMIGEQRFRLQVG